MKSFYIQQLKRLPKDRQLELHDQFAKICCPVHNNGRERTPSLKFNLERSGNFKAGSAVCFACGEFHQWNEWAKILKLKPENDGANTFDLDLSMLDRNKFFSDDENTRQMDKLLEFAPLWSKKDTWRGISGKILHNVGGRLISTDYGPRLYLPAYVDGQFKGGITCLLNKSTSKKAIKYRYDSGSWIKETIYPFDYTKDLLKKSRVLFYVEGSRDALNPLQYDIPTVANLGGVTVWSKRKAELILDLNPKLLILATDPDEIGQKLAELIKADIGKYIPMKRLNYPKKWFKHLKEGDKADPGVTTKERWLYLKYKLGIK